VHTAGIPSLSTSILQFHYCFAVKFCMCLCRTLRR
jgi:hypothetical protein